MIIGHFLQKSPLIVGSSFMSHLRMSHVTHTSLYESHVWIVVRVNESYHTYELLHAWMSHITRTNYCMREWVISHVRIVVYAWKKKSWRNSKKKKCKERSKSEKKTYGARRKSLEERAREWRLVLVLPSFSMACQIACSSAGRDSFIRGTWLIHT